MDGNPLQQLRKFLEPYSKEELQLLLMNMASTDPRFCTQMIDHLSSDKKWCKLFVHGLNFTTSKESLEKYYTQYGTVREAVVLVDKKGNSKGFGFVTFSTAIEAMNAVKMDKKKIDGRITHCNLAFKGNPKKFFIGLPNGTSANPSSPHSLINNNSNGTHNTLAVSPKARHDASDRRLFVHSLAWKTDDKSLAEAFGAYGELHEAVVIKDKKTGKSRGFGFVTFRTAVSAANALQLPNKKIDGRQTHCNLASERQSSSNNNNTNDNYMVGNGIINNTNIFANNTQPIINRLVPNISVSGMGLNMIGINNFPNNIVRNNSDPFMFTNDINQGSFATFPRMINPNIISNHLPPLQYPPPTNIPRMNNLLSPQQSLNSNPPQNTLLMNQLLSSTNPISMSAMPISAIQTTTAMPLSSMPNYNPLMQWTPSRTRSTDQLLIETDSSAGIHGNSAMIGLPMMPGLPGIPAFPSFLNASKSFNSIGLPSPFFSGGLLSPMNTRTATGMNGHFDDMLAANKKIVSAGGTSDKFPMFQKRMQTRPLTAANLNMFDNMNNQTLTSILNRNGRGVGHGSGDRFHNTHHSSNVQMLVTSPPTMNIDVNATLVNNSVLVNGNAQSPKTQHSDEDRK